MKRFSKSLEITILVAVVVAVAVVVYLYYACGPEKCVGFAERVLFLRR